MKKIKKIKNKNEEIMEMDLEYGKDIEKKV